MPAEVRELGDERGRVDGAHPRRQAVTGGGAEALDRVELVVLGERHGVVAPVTSTMPGAWAADSSYRYGLIRPSRWWATWSASATMPENSGVASLVPQIGYQPGVCPPKLW